MESEHDRRLASQREILRVVEPGGIVVLGDIPDRDKRELSFEERERRRRPPVNLALESVRRVVMDLFFGARPYGFYPMSFFERLGAMDGHACRIVAQTPFIERSGWRVDVVVRKRQ